MRDALMSLLMVAAAPAWAEWVRLGGTEVSVTYYDPATIQKSGYLRRVLMLQDFKQKASDGVMSMQSLEEFDCNENRCRGISGSMYERPMATGRTIHSTANPSRWQRDFGSPDSTLNVIYGTVCAR